MASRIALPSTAFSLDPSGKHERIRDERHLAFIRKLPSVISGIYGCEACHIRYGNPAYKKPTTGKAKRPDDGWTVPMLPDEHRSQHRQNERQWWLQRGIDPLAIAVALYEVSGDVQAGIEIIRKAMNNG